MAPLFPKLRGQFAEFLDNNSSAGLRILSSPTCVGLRYGRIASTLYRIFLPPGVSDFWCFHPASWSLTTCHRNPLNGSPSLEVLCITPHSGTGILTGCPSRYSASRPRLRLRLTHGRIILPQETLGLRRPSFSLGLSLLMPAFSLDHAPRPVTLPLHCEIDAPPPLDQRSNPWLRYQT